MLPFATELLTIERQDAPPDADSETDYTDALAPWRVIGTNVRGRISQPSGRQTFSPTGERVVVVFPFVCDPLPDGSALQSDDQLTDQYGQVYSVDWARMFGIGGFRFVKGTLQQKAGE